MPIPRKQFEVWIRRQLFQQSERLTKFIVRHGTATSRLGQVLIHIDVPQPSTSEVEDWDDWINQAIDEIENTTQADADGSSTGVEKYIIQAFHGDLNRPSANFNIRMASETSAEDDGIMSEPATKSGLLSQLMRHNEVMMRTSTMAQAHVLNAMQKTLNKQETVIERLLNEKFENITVVEQLMSQKQERDLEIKVHEHKVEMQEKLFDKAMLTLPIVAQKLLGKGGDNSTPSQMSTIEQQIATLSETLTEPQLEAFTKILDQDQLISLFNLITTAREKQDHLLQKKNDVPDEK